MSNMSHCRFQNTLGDLQDCSGALEELFAGEPDSNLSRDELRAAIDLVEMCRSIITQVQDRLLGDGQQVDDILDVSDARIRELIICSNNLAMASTNDDDEPPV